MSKNIGLKRRTKKVIYGLFKNRWNDSILS